MDKTQRSTRRRLLGAAALSTVLFVAACGAEVSDGEDSTTQGGGGTQDLGNQTTDPTDQGDASGQDSGDGAGDESGDGDQSGDDDSGDGDGESTDTGSTDQTTDQGGTEGSKGSLMLVMDASGSMHEADEDGETRLDGAKTALRDLVNNVPDGLDVGLRVYGHTVDSNDKDAGCRDTELIAPVGPLDADSMLEAIDGYEAVGHTPIGYSLQKAAEDLPAEGQRSIILVSDGEDTCAPPPPCEVAEELADQGVDLAVHTVGFALGDNQQAREDLECIAETTGGEYRDVGTAAELNDTLQEVTERERRRVEVAGSALEGAPVPQRATDVGEVNATYTDTVLLDEINFYRIAVPSGAEIQAEVIVAGNEANDCGWKQLEASFADAGDNESGKEFTRDDAQQAQVVQTESVDWEDDEAWLKVYTKASCDDIEGEFNIEFQVKTVG